MSEVKLPPHNIEAEEYILSAILIDSDCIHDIPELKPEHFYRKMHGAVFGAFRDMIANNVIPDMVTTPDYIVDIDVMWLSGLVSLMSPSYHVRSYAAIVVNHAKRRQIIESASQMAKTAWDEVVEIDDVLDTVSGMLLDVVVDDTRKGVVPVKGEVDKLIDVVAERAVDGGGMRGISTGYAKLDDVVRGFRKSTLTIVAGRPGMGKTALGTNMVQHMAEAGKRVLFFTLEMSMEQVLFRMASQMSGISYIDIEEAVRITPGGSRYASVMSALARLSELPVLIDDTPSITVEQMYAKSQREMALGGVDAIVIDYLQLMGTNVEGNRVAQVSAMSQGLQGLSKRLDVPVIAVAQLSRKVEERENKHPRLSDLRDSGQIEQDAAVVLFVYRDDYYYGDEGEQGVADINVAKNRFGPSGKTVKLGWIAECGRFTNDIVTRQL